MLLPDPHRHRCSRDDGAQVILGHLRVFPYAPICNCRRDRALHLGRYRFPLCWRCTAIITVMVAMQGTVGPWWLGLLLMLPCLVDSLLQYRWGIESTTARRIATGLLAGWGCAVLMRPELIKALCRL